MSDEPLDPTQLATDEMPDGIEAPSDDELLAYLDEQGCGPDFKELFDGMG